MSEIPFVALFAASLVAETLRQTVMNPMKIVSQFQSTLLNLQGAQGATNPFAAFQNIMQTQQSRVILTPEQRALNEHKEVIEGL